LQQRFPDVSGRSERRQLAGIVSGGADLQLLQMVRADPSVIGERRQVALIASDDIDSLLKGDIDRDRPEDDRRVKDNEIAWIDQLEADGAILSSFNSEFWTKGDSREPELAGFWGAMVGSFYTLLVTLLLSFPVGVMAATYLEEFAPKNRVSDLIEVNINNLAAVPSVVFGLLALAVFLNWFGLPRSAPLVGGMTLALMTMPTMIIATRAALKAVPPSIREAALGVGASKHQVIFQHVLPLAMPGILTGTIIGLAQALGETAPLLLIGMNAFITSAPATPLDSATALPTQIFIWADSPERGFVSRTSAAILVLLMFLIVMNAIAIFLRNRFERQW
ncbi:phosphate ABC transporter permease PstA, partial [Roseitalea porphyridii]|uniref:phosphate ABC transporter permease PstA n=1 Tax=Roseitalea porphyridii TaxID=1852022 RepID=UPI0032F025BF